MVWRETGSSQSDEWELNDNENVVLTQLVGIVTFSIVIGMFFIQGFENLAAE
jgi:hypothetical protein